MRPARCILPAILATGLATGLLISAEEEPSVVFRSDVSLVRVDVQALDRDNRAITGLTLGDFVLREAGKPREIRNFATEDMPVDVLLLLDVSGSMRPHLLRVASAASQALDVLGKDDRVGVMVFDRMTRMRLPFRKSKVEVERELRVLLDQETFDGGTDITRALHDAARHMQRQGRVEARRAIVIVTDDQTEFDADEPGVLRALSRADTVLSALIAPNALRGMGRGQPGGRRGGIGFPGGGGWPGGGGGGWPGGGGGWPGGGGGGRQPGPAGRSGGTRSAGTAEIAQESGGDSFPVNQASALDATLERLRQRYALYFQLPDGVRAGEERSIDVQLSAAVSRRFPDAELRFRRTYVPSNGSAPGSPAEQVSSDSTGWRKASTQDTVAASEPESSGGASRTRRRPAINETGGSAGPKRSSAETGPATPASTQDPPRGWRRADEPAPAEPPAPEPDPDRPILRRKP